MILANQKQIQINYICWRLAALHPRALCGCFVEEWLYVLLTRLNPHPHLVQNLCFRCPLSRVQSRVLIARLLPQWARFLYRCCSILISRHAFLASPSLGGFETKPRKCSKKGWALSTLKLFDSSRNLFNFPFHYFLIRLDFILFNSITPTVSQLFFILLLKTFLTSLYLTWLLYFKRLLRKTGKFLICIQSPLNLAKEYGKEDRRAQWRLRRMIFLHSLNAPRTR